MKTSIEFKETYYLKQTESRLKRRYEFLRSVSFILVDGKETCYDPDKRNIYINVSQLRNIFGTPRFTRRFGNILAFNDFLLLILLHETKHVQQWDTIPEHRLRAAMREVAYETDEGHDDCWIEQEADEWARDQFRKMR